MKLLISSTFNWTQLNPSIYLIATVNAVDYMLEGLIDLLGEHSNHSQIDHELDSRCFNQLSQTTSYDRHLQAQCLQQGADDQVSNLTSAGLSGRTSVRGVSQFSTFQ